VAMLLLVKWVNIPKQKKKLANKKKSSQQNVWLFYKVANSTQNVLVA
jgi:hypothetical protein